ncbi:Aminopeptidase N [Pseudobythopirellula maris]|uniref:Aminopeptidase N n=1 Tax=Pseudobythopirellula maris TaxID=2527991 RepID=A0A5C5ZP65_9BACT|nr:M1 family aminopeptidase [Pseudobythopirellula maris]TWT88990.1 Aminopeptidase N [Pseudobythopirellula maris]
MTLLSTIKHLTLLPLFASLLATSAAAYEEQCVCHFCQLAAQSASQSQADEEEPSPAPRRYAPDRLVDVLRIRIDVTPDFRERTLAAKTTIEFAPIAKPLGVLRLDAVDLSVESLTAEGAEVETYANDDREITIVFAEPVAVGQRASVTIAYTAEPKRGFYFRTPELGYPAEDEHVWTQGQTHEARHWFPCLDYPNERSATEVICRVPPSMTVVSNGRLAGEGIDGATGLKAVHWVQEKPHAAYLVCLAAGRFEKLEKTAGDVPLAFYTQPSLVEHAANSFEDSDKIISFFEREIGVDYPWDKYDQVTIRDFNSGGMENTSITTLTHRTIFTAATENIYTSRRLDAHEAAHQWFGDYVTCRDWSHLWLNEGFATYYAHLYEGEKYGRDALHYGLLRDADRSIFPQSSDTRPIVTREYENAWDQFDFRNYPKASWVLHMLRSRLGEKTYRAAIKNYLERYALTSVVTEDLVRELESASGLALGRFFDQWVYHGGHPVLRVKYKWLAKEKLAHVTVEQKQTTGDAVLLFRLPTKLRFVVQGDPVGRVVDHDIVIKDAKHDFYVALPKEPAVVRFDPEFTLLADVTFDKPQKLRERQLTQETDAIGRVLAAKRLGGKDNRKAVAALKRALGEDPFYGVRIAAAESLAETDTDAAFEALVASRRQGDARVRLAVVESIARCYRAEAVDRLIETVKTEPNPLIVAAAVRGLGQYTGAKAKGAVADALRRESFFNEIAAAAITAMGQQSNEETADAMFATLREREKEFSERQMRDLAVALAQVWKDRDDRSQVRLYLETMLRHVSQARRRAAAAALGELGDPASLPVLERLARAEDDRLAATAAASVKQLTEKTPAVPKEVQRLRESLRELSDDQAELSEKLEQLESKSEAG